METSSSYGLTNAFNVVSANNQRMYVCYTLYTIHYTLYPTQELFGAAVGFVIYTIYNNVYLQCSYTLFNFVL